MTIAYCGPTVDIRAGACAIDNSAGKRNLVGNVDESWLFAEDDLGCLWQLCEGHQLGSTQRSL